MAALLATDPRTGNAVSRALLEVAMVLAFVCLVPVAIIAVGLPLVLAVRLLLWLAGGL